MLGLADEDGSEGDGGGKGEALSVSGVGADWEGGVAALACEDRGDLGQGGGGRVTE